jgi:hypothetical protein
MNSKEVKHGVVVKHDEQQPSDKRRNNETRGMTKHEGTMK